ncbi:hypothetical protein ACJX0J_015370, partial [Zea mays]
NVIVIIIKKYDIAVIFFYLEKKMPTLITITLFGYLDATIKGPFSCLVTPTVASSDTDEDAFHVFLIIVINMIF